MKICKAKSRHRYFSPGVIVVYFFAHFGLLLLGNHPFWDDWILVDAPKEQILETGRQMGLFFNFFGYLHVAMLAVGPWFYRLSTFILYYGIGYYFYLILRRTRLLEERQAFLAAVIFLVLPFNLGRGALCLFPYTLCLFIFMLAWSILPQKRFLSLLLFFISFNTNSLLVFYLLPLVEDFREFALKSLPNQPFTSLVFLSHCRKYLFSRPATVTLPLVYYITKFLFFRPYGFYLGYNEDFSIFKLLLSPVYQLWYWAGSSIKGYPSSVLVLAVVIVLIVVFVRAAKLCLINYWILGISLSILVLGMLPYYILGHVPSFTEWTSRHQLLMPFGFSILVAYGIGVIRPEGLAKKMLIILIALCVLVSAFNSALFRADALKQQAIQRFMANTLDPKKPGLVLIEDKTANALMRTYRFYEVNGMLSRAVNAQSFFGVPYMEIVDYRQGKYDQYFSPHYNAAAHRRKPYAATSVILIDSLSRLKTIYPFGIRACVVEIPFPSSLSVAPSRLDCPSERWARLD